MLPKKNGHKNVGLMSGWGYGIDDHSKKVLPDGT